MAPRSSPPPRATCCSRRFPAGAGSRSSATCATTRPERLARGRPAGSRVRIHGTADRVVGPGAGRRLVSRVPHAPPGGGPARRQPAVPAGRCRSPVQSVRRRGPELRPARRPQPGLEARARAARTGPARPAGQLRGRSAAPRPGTCWRSRTACTRWPTARSRRRGPAATPAPASARAGRRPDSRAIDAGHVLPGQPAHGRVPGSRPAAAWPRRRPASGTRIAPGCRVRLTTC